MLRGFFFTPKIILHVIWMLLDIVQIKTNQYKWNIIYLHGYINFNYLINFMFVNILSKKWYDMYEYIPYTLLFKANVKLWDVEISTKTVEQFPSSKSNNNNNNYNNKIRTYIFLNNEIISENDIFNEIVNKVLMKHFT